MKVQPWQPAEEEGKSLTRALNDRVIKVLTTMDSGPVVLSRRKGSKPRPFNVTEVQLLCFILRHGRQLRSWGHDSMTKVDHSLSWRTGISVEVVREARLSLTAAGFLVEDADIGRMAKAVWVTERLWDWTEAKLVEKELRVAFPMDRWLAAAQAMGGEDKLVERLLETYESIPPVYTGPHFTTPKDRDSQRIQQAEHAREKFLLLNKIPMRPITFKKGEHDNVLPFRFAPNEVMNL